MKRNNLLVLLPAILILSSCQAAPKVNNQNNLKEDTFIEDSLAHDEIFGNEFVGRKIAPKKLGDDPVSHPDSDSAIGVQTLVDNKDNADPSDDTISFRFVAPVAFGEGELGNTRAVWTRTVSSPDGTSYPMDTDTYECAEAYTQLREGSGVYTIAQFNEAQEPDTNYTHFVVYTLRNIPLATYANYYISAYLTLSGEDGVNQVSKAIVSTVNPAIYQAAYSPLLGNFFITGTFGGTPNRILATSTRTSDEDANKATFEGLSLAKNDKFVINEFYNTKLYVKNVAKFTGENNHSGYYFVDDSDEMKTNFNGSYNLYLTKDDQIYTTASNVVRPLYVSLKDVSWWTGDGAWTAICVFNNSTSVSAWYKMSVDGDYLVSSADIDPTVYNQLCVVRMKADSASKEENELSWEDKYYNQTVDLTIPHNDIKECVYVADSETDGKKNASWGTRD